MRRLLPLLLLLFAGGPTGATASQPVAWEESPGDGPERVDPRTFKLQLASPDGAFKMRLSLTAQSWLVVSDAGITGGERDRSAVLELRRVRPVISGNAFTKRFKYMIHLSVLTGNFELMDMVGEYAFVPQFRVRFGQFKIPYSRYRIRSYKHRQLVDWAVVSKYFGAERQNGILFHNGFLDRTPPKLEWAVGVFDGINARTAHAVGPSKLFAPEEEVEAGASIHPEVVARVALNHGGIDTTGEGDLEGGPLRFAVSLNGAWDLRPEMGQDWAMRGAVDALMKVRGVSLAGTFYVASVQDGPSVADQTPGAVGAWAAVGGVIEKRVEIAGEYALVYPLICAPSIHEVRGGVNVFILGRRVQWRTDAGAAFSMDDDANPTTDIQVRSVIQMQI